MGRFSSRDELGYVGDANIYAYSDSTPVSRVDPLGLQADCADAGCCVTGKIQLKKEGALVGGFTLNDYADDWGNLEEPDKLGLEFPNQYKVQMYAPYTGDKSCKATQTALVAKLVGPEKEVKKLLQGLQQRFGVDDIKLNKPYEDREISGGKWEPQFTETFMTFADAPGDFSLSLTMVFGFTTCFHSTGSNCTYKKCCVEWAFLWNTVGKTGKDKFEIISKPEHSYCVKAME